MAEEKSVRVPQQARSIEKRQRLISAAAELFDRNGYDGVTAKTIAVEAGVSVGTFYAYFEDKKDVLMAILAEHLEQVDTSVFDELRQAVARGEPGREIVRLAVRAGHATHTQPAGLMRMMLALRYTDPDMRRMRSAEESAMQEKLVTLLESQRHRLRVTDIEAAARVTGAAMEEVLHSLVADEPAIPIERQLDALGDMIATYLYTDPDARD